MEVRFRRSEHDADGRPGDAQSPGSATPAELAVGEGGVTEDLKTEEKV
jgi:hypothetical protein